MNRRSCLAAFAFLACAAQLMADRPTVRLWETNLVIPTYAVAPPDPNPRFHQGRTYQGAKATFYPYPVSDRLTDTREDRTYKAVFLENPYVQFIVMPELGGRIFSAVDKSNGYDFFYRQHVVKPALIGMLGAWISGGVEWNVPHHHRATSFMPVDCTLQANPDGSKTVWVGEIELRHRLKWLVGITLYPDRSCLELTCKVLNRTPFAHPILFWINPAVHANENYQVVFPPDAEWAVQHGKPEFASWPIARQIYGGTDYTRGVDISWWKNHPSPVSFFCFHSDQDFFGGYDHGRRAGVLHVADHHVAPGKKFFEWGNGAEGEMWSRILTDEDGPYLELMAGAWSDNQPDYSWIQPGEVKEWKHYWYPIRELGAAKSATIDAALNLEVTNRVAAIACNTTREHAAAKVRLELRGEGGGTPSATLRKTLYEHITAIGPAKPFSATIMIENDVPPDSLRLSLSDAAGRELAAYQPAKPKGAPMPKPVEKPRPPGEYATADELYFTGQRIEQLYSPSFDAASYYEEMLRRDPGDYRANTALGILLCKQWRWEDAAGHLRQAVDRATANYIRPKDGEAFYYLGVAWRAQGKTDAARDALQKALWSHAWQAAAGFELAEIALQQNAFAEALGHVDTALAASARNVKARCLKSTILRGLGRPEEAERLAAETLAMDPLNVRAASELALAQRQRGAPEWKDTVGRLRGAMRGNPEAYLENAFDFANAGQWREVAESLQDHVTSAEAHGGAAVATEHYLLALALERLGRSDEATERYAIAARTAPDFCFPSRFEEEALFRRAMEVNPKDARAPYYLGCLLYDNQPGHAIRAWEISRERDDTFALVHRNLGVAYAQHEKNAPKAIASYERAIDLNPNDPRYFYELDLQYEAAGVTVARRLDMLTRHHAAVAQRDDALTREIVLLTAAGESDRALDLLKTRRFRNWEGSSEIHNVYVNACLRRGQQKTGAGKVRETLGDFEAALEYPENLEVGRARRAARAAEIHYLIGTAQEALGESEKAKTAFEMAAGGRKDRASSEGDYYRALALRKLGRASEAAPLFEGLVKAGTEQLARGEAADYFAKFGEKQADRVRQAQAHYLVGLGQLGLGRTEEARTTFAKALELHPAHLGAIMQTEAKQ